MSGRLARRRLLLLLGWLVLHHYPLGCRAGEDAEAETRRPYLVPLQVQSCFPCHGPRGQSGSSAIPSLAGLPRDYLLQVMRAYRHGGRFGTVMGRLAAAYEEVDLIAMADYFSGQPIKPQKQSTEWRLADLGRRLHRYYCRDCHGGPEESAKPGVPHLHGRWMDYLRWTLWDYLVGINQGDEEMATQLTALMRRHGAKGVEALLHYYGKGEP
ncbi:MAG: hypothetical protein AB2728_02695 [Candidatus Thiodiazotropha sp.]|nr:hypothetical protein [Candidatus Thiodiazotropha taylori]MBT3059807.1 hypothetical protein [Candidatus Thiodiazotropha sp. (ex Lucina pensylvanica)]MBV2094325.1 hypothetical protein [Candidatus Thiodiazotropha sp. (ex Codakia orbicularis)]PUB73000.1 MAG: hypothetical protein DBP03_14395 [gamma proteobacterium symbiont of Ctena orbiculata]MBT3063016.1 hypothetical protein [Candidatus Thiodiazotropha sp. (ex Lucina pensylvanica)]